MSRRITLSVFLITGILGAIACSGSSDDAPPANPGTSSGSSGSSSGSSGSSSGSSGGGGVDSSTPDLDAGMDADGDGGAQWVGPDGGVSTAMTFFVTSKGGAKGGDFRANAGDANGLAGADAFCKSLANAVSPVLGAKDWKAYLSITGTTARSRIGNGPWLNAKGVMIASSVANLHDEGAKNMLSLTTNLDELGNQVSITGPNVHDILTGTTAAGASAAGNCTNWTSNATNVQAMVGHSNRAGGGADPTSWNAAHAITGCKEGTGAGTVASGGGRGSIYCFVP
jgi:hypothetical protein